MHAELGTVELSVELGEADLGPLPTWLRRIALGELTPLGQAPADLGR